MDYRFLVAVFCIFVASCCGKAIDQKDDDHHWDYLLLAQFWPASSCKYFEEKGESCSIPSYVEGWTIHGLWPSRPDSSILPHNCNDSMPFDYDQIASLRSNMDKDWHFYESDKEATYLWQHEWEKHGTCAYSLPALRGEMNYFKKTLQLHSMINITKALEQSQVVPSKNNTYKREDFYNAVYKYQSYKPVIVCDYASETKTTYIDQVYLCFTKSFQPQDCYPPQRDSGYYEGCLEKDDIYYLPYNTNQHKSNTLYFQSEISKN